MKKELKRQIKQDEFVTWIERSWQWIGSHRQELRTLGLVAAGLVVVLSGLSWFQSSRAAAARADWRAALEAFHAPLESDLTEGAPRPAGPVFQSEEERYKAAMGAFDGFARRFPRHELLPRAQYYAALCHLELGEFDQAEALLTEVSARRDRGTVESALALMALGGAYRQQGRFDDAVETYRRLLDDAESPLPRDHALMQLAESLERADRLAEARASYERLLHEYPSSAHAGEAQRRAEDLERAG